MTTNDNIIRDLSGRSASRGIVMTIGVEDGDSATTLRVGSRRKDGEKGGGEDMAIM
jgi:hypothetical protein